jgi:Zn-dependent alcohol dehydrogenase
MRLPKFRFASQLVLDPITVPAKTLIELHALGRFPLEKLVTFYPFWDINQVIEDFLSGKCVKPILRF